MAWLRTPRRFDLEASFARRTLSDASVVCASDALIRKRRCLTIEQSQTDDLQAVHSIRRIAIPIPVLRKSDDVEVPAVDEGAVVGGGDFVDEVFLGRVP